MAASGTTTADLTLRKAHSLATQLTNAEWLASFPGTDQQKASVRNCAHCHTLELVTNTKHSAESFTKVIERMAGYPPLAFPLMLQRTPAPRIGPGAVSREQQLQTWRTQAEYLGPLNLGTGTQWTYPLKTFPRPSGAATRVVYTQIATPARAHAAAARRDRGLEKDQNGMPHSASRSSARWIRRPARIAEFTVPTLKPGREGHPRDALRRGREPVARAAVPGRHREVRSEDREVPGLEPAAAPQWRSVQVNQVGPDHPKVDGKVWFQDAGTYRVLRLDLKTGAGRGVRALSISRGPTSTSIPDADNNAYYLPFGAEEMGRIDAKTGKIQFQDSHEGVGAAARHDRQLGAGWFGKNLGDRIGMFDTKTQQFKEWPPTTPGWPYEWSSIAPARRGPATNTTIGSFG